MITHGKQNAFYACFDEVCEIMRRYAVSFADLAGEPGQQHPAGEGERQQQAENRSGKARIARAHDPERGREDAREPGADPHHREH